MKRKISVILSLVIVITALSACNVKENVIDKISTQNSENAVGKTKTYPDYITLGVENSVNFSPYEKMSEGNLQTLRIAYESIFAYDDDMRVIPVLAEGFVASEDGKQITVTLKDDIKCHNGDTLNAKDVLNSAELMKAAGYDRFSSEIRQISIVDQKTFMVSFLVPQSNPAERLMFPIVKTDGTEVAGTGPYKFEKKESTDTYLFSAFEDYHGMKPAIKQIRILNAEDTDTLLRLFEIGGIDVLPTGVIDYATYSVGAHANVYDYTTNELVFLGLNFDNSIFWGESSRQAIQYIIDKKEIVEKGLYKKAEETDFLINPHSWLYPKDLEYQKDTVLAEKLLLEDSWTRVDGVFARMLDGQRQDFEVDLLVMEDPQSEIIAQMISDDLNSFGIKCNVTKKPEASFLQSVQAKSYDLVLNKIMLRGSGDLETLTGEGNMFGYLNSELDKISAGVRTQTDEQMLLESYKKYCAISMKDVQFIPLYFKKDAIITGSAVSENVECGIDNPFYNICEWNR